MNDLQVFNFNGSDVRTLTKDGNPWWVAKDVCDVLGLSNIGEAVSSLDDDEKSKISNSDLGRAGGHDAPIINESGLYSLTLRSRKPEAKAFKRWVTSEVLPQIRKTGGYVKLTGQALVATALIEANKMLEQQAAQIEAMKPAAQFYADVAGSRDAIPMSQAAKIIGMGIGRNRLFTILRDNGVLMANNEPYQKYIDNRWFRVVEQKYTLPDGEVKISIKTLVYQKGIEGIIKLIRSQR